MIKTSSGLRVLAAVVLLSGTASMAGCGGGKEVRTTTVERSTSVAPNGETSTSMSRTVTKEDR